MHPQVIAAVIAAIGVLISAALAFVVSRRQTRAQLEAARVESQTAFLGKLYETRLRVYPALYEFLGDLGGKVLSGDATVQDVQQTWDAIRAWDRQNALFLSSFSTKTMISLRGKLIPLTQLAPHELSKSRQKKELLPALIDMQMCLKAELGILHADGFHSPVRRETLREAISRTSLVEDGK